MTNIFFCLEFSAYVGHKVFAEKRDLNDQSSFIRQTNFETNHGIPVP